MSVLLLVRNVLVHGQVLGLVLEEREFVPHVVRVLVLESPRVTSRQLLLLCLWSVNGDTVSSGVTNDSETVTYVICHCEAGDKLHNCEIVLYLF